MKILLRLEGRLAAYATVRLSINLPIWMVKLLKNIPLVDNISVRRISPTGTWIFFGLKVPDTGDGWPIYFVDYLFAWIPNSRLLQGERSIYLPSSTHSCY